MGLINGLIVIAFTVSSFTASFTSTLAYRVSHQSIEVCNVYR